MTTEMTIQPDPKRDHLLSNEQYDILQKGVALVLPGAGAFYFTISSIWGLPFGDQIVGTCAAIALFAGILLRVATRSYNNSESKFDGVINVTDTSERKLFDIAINDDPEDLDKKDEVLFRINSSPGVSNQ